MPSKRYFMVMICCVGALVGIAFLTLILGVAIPVRVMATEVIVDVSITENGFDPPELTVDLGTTVKWTNNTQQRVRMVSSEPQCVFLPLTIFDEGDVSLFNAKSNESAELSSQTTNGWINETFEPGESFEYTFTAAGEYPYFQAECSKGKGLVLVTEAGDFKMTVQPDSRNVSQGRSTTYTVTLTAVDGFTRSVDLAAGGLPEGATTSWSLNPVAPTADSTLTITPSLSSPTGTYTLAVTGTSGVLVHSVTAELVVESAGNFTMEIEPDSRNVSQGQSTTYTVPLTAVDGFIRSVDLETGGLPEGAAISWSLNPVTPTADSTLTITPSLSSPTGTYTLVVTGTSGVLVHSVTAELVVEELIVPKPGYYVGSSPDISFDVTEEEQVCNLDITVPFGLNKCRIQPIICADIIDMEFSFSSAVIGAVYSISGTFDTQTSASGDYRVSWCESGVIIPASTGDWEAFNQD